MEPYELFRWCANDNSYTFSLVGQHLNRPFTDGVYTYATNGFVLVRIPGTTTGLGGVPECLDKTISRDALGLASGEFNYQDLPPSGGSPAHECKKCRGIGRVALCDECGNTGETTYHGKSGDFDIDCPACACRRPAIPKGFLVHKIFGETVECDECCGSGFSFPEVTIWNCLSLKHEDTGKSFDYSHHQVDSFRHLPEIKYAIAKDGVMHLKWNGGIAVIMRMNFTRP